MDKEYEKNEKFRELCYIGDLELVKSFFMQQKPDVNSKNKINEWSALHWGAKQNNFELVKFLLDVGALSESLNKDGKTAAQLTKDYTIKNLLGCDETELFSSKESSSASFMPNFVRNPDFHYGNKYLYESGSSSLKKSKNQVKVDATIVDLNVPKRDDQADNDFITIRIKSSHDEDFIEIDVDTLNTDFEKFKEICYKELDHIEVGKSILKIRKLPNILIRNTNDVKRLKNEQEIEIFFI